MRQQYAYDSADRINEMIVMQGSLNQIDLKYQYDRVGRLTAVNDNGKWFTYQYDEIGRLINQQNGVNGINSEYSYYPSGNVRSLRHFNSGEIVANYEYQYDMRGNQIQKDEGANTSRYYYDALSRIKVAQLPGDVTQNYEYDDLNNIREIAEIKGTQIAQTNFTYDHNSRLRLSETVNGDNLKQQRFEYDSEGNEIYKEEVDKQNGNLTASKAYNFWYNGYNQLSRVQDPDGDFIEYTYNAQGLRTKKDFIDHSTNYIYDRSNIILESDQDYLVTAKNIRGLQLIYRETGDETLHYLHNAHGDVTKLLNDKGWVIKDYDYDPFGREEAAPIKAFGGDVTTEIWRNETQQIDNPFRYCGEYLDSETGNYYLRARYYDPEARRFTTEDSYRGDINKPLTLNGFTYCENNPIKFVDPSGLSAATAEWSANQYAYLNSLLSSSDAGIAAWARAQLNANNVYVDENGTVFTNDEVYAAKNPNIFNSKAYKWFEKQNPVVQTAIAIPVAGATAATTVVVAVVAEAAPALFSIETVAQIDTWGVMTSNSLSNAGKVGSLIAPLVPKAINSAKKSLNNIFAGPGIKDYANAALNTLDFVYRSRVDEVWE